MRTLVALAGREEELHRARRQFGYDRLVLVAPQGKGARLRAALGPEASSAELLEVPDEELLGCLEACERLLAGLKGQVRVAVDGGSQAMMFGALLACLSQGFEAWFLEHKPVRLPILRGLPIERRFREEELVVLRALEGKLSVPELARRAGLAEDRVKEALLALRRQGAVRTDASGAERTALGLYYQRALGGAR